MNKHFLLHKSRYFCMLPWVHLHLWPNGDAFACCQAKSNQPIGNYKYQNIRELWNSNKMRLLRKNMLEEKPSSECERCYLFDKNTQINTLRTSSNRNYAHHWKQVESTQKDGTVEKLMMPYMDIRFSNICNFRCRTCGPHLSSSWFEDQIKLHGYPGFDKVLEIPSKDKFWQELSPLLHDVEEVYFAGGEPLLSEDHYKILDFWLEHKKTNISLQYTTNFSHLVWQKKKVLDYWKHFPKVSISASLDASNKKAEYIRKGTRWEKILQNRAELAQECPHVRFEITPTISIYNVWDFPDFHNECIEIGLITPNAIRLNLLTFPEHMSMQILPKKIKNKIKEKYQLSLEKMKVKAKSHNEKDDRIIAGYQSVIHFLEQENFEERKKDFLLATKSMDKVRSENLFHTFPELSFYQSKLEKIKSLWQTRI